MGPACAEETALLESPEGGRGVVRAKPPIRLSGLYGRPTIEQCADLRDDLKHHRRGGA
ncbi:MAG: hypothetical protein U0361_10940 [Nitrospiraceae bacterium]